MADPSPGTADPAPLDLDAVRAHFPVFDHPEGAVAHLENAGGSHVCRQTLDALTDHLTRRRVQPGYPAGPSAAAAEAMEAARARWATAMGLPTEEVHLGPSASANAHVLARAWARSLGPGDEVVVTDADHETNRGFVSRVAAEAGATVRVWPLGRHGVLAVADLVDLLTPRTRIVHVPHVSNVVGVTHDVATASRLAHDVGARVVVDAVSAAPHAVPDPLRLGADVYLCSLYKVYSVHQGLMTVRRDLLDELDNQSHFFNADVVHKKLNPAGPDHAQVAASAAVLDYVEASAAEHGITGDVRTVAARLSERWRAHEAGLTERILAFLRDRDDVSIVGPDEPGVGGHRVPTIAFVPRDTEPAAVAAALAERGVAVGAGHFYSWRTLDALGIDPTRGVVRASAVHYTSHDDVDRLLGALADVLYGA